MDIKSYINKVIRCYKCGRFNHLPKKCNVEDKYLNCGDKKHQLNKENKCDKIIKCINCSQNHHCLNILCPAFLEAKEINKIMSNENISFAEAQSKVNKNKKKSYSEVTKQNTYLNQSSTQNINKKPNIIQEFISKFIELCSSLPGGFNDLKKFVEEIVNTMCSFFLTQFSQNKEVNNKKNKN